MICNSGDPMCLRHPVQRKLRFPPEYLSYEFPLILGFGGRVVRGLQIEQILIMNIVNEYFTQQAF